MPRQAIHTNKASFSIIICLVVLSIATPAKSQPKIGVFDIDTMVHALPQYKAIDTLMSIFEDSMSTQYNILVSEFNKTTEIFLNSDRFLSNRRCKDSIATRRNDISLAIIYWLPMYEQYRTQKARAFAEPLYEKVEAAFKKVINGKHYDLIIKPSCIEMALCNADNLFIAVAKELQLGSLPDRLVNLVFPKYPDK